MKQVMTDSKQKKSNDSFFEDEYPSENRSISFSNRSEVLANRNFTAEEKKFYPVFILMKQIFLFLPGTFLLYLIGFIGTIILTTGLSLKEDTELFGIRSSLIQIFVFGLIAIIGTFMTWFGLGDLKNKKHLAIPLSIIITGGIIAVVFKILADVFGLTELYEFMNYYFIYLFPLVLIVPILVKGWVDRKTANS